MVSPKDNEALEGSSSETSDVSAAEMGAEAYAGSRVEEAVSEGATNAVTEAAPDGGVAEGGVAEGGVAEGGVAEGAFEVPSESSAELDAIREEIAAAMAKGEERDENERPALSAASESERRWASWGCLLLGCAAIFGFWFFVRYAPMQLEELETVDPGPMEAYQPDPQPLPDELPSVPGVSPRMLNGLRQVQWTESFNEALEEAAADERYILMLVASPEELEAVQQRLFESPLVGAVCQDLVVVVQGRLPDVYDYLAAPEAGGFGLPRMLLLSAGGQPLSHWSVQGLSPESFASTVDDAVAEVENAGLADGETVEQGSPEDSADEVP